MSTNLVVYQDETTRWGHTPYEAMVNAAKDRQRRLVAAHRQTVKDLLDRTLEAHQRREETLRIVDQQRREDAVWRARHDPSAPPAPITLPEIVALRKQRHAQTVPQFSVNWSRAIVKVVGEHYGASSALIYGRCRVHKVAFCRQVAMFLISQFTGWSTTRVGMYFKIDHSTVIYSLEKIQNKLDGSPSFKYDVLDLQRLIENKLAELAQSRESLNSARSDARLALSVASSAGDALTGSSA